MAEVAAAEVPPMKSEQITQWLAAAPAVYQWSREHPETASAHQITDITQLSEVFSQRVRASGKDSEALSQLLSKHGFNNYDEWSQMFERLMLAVSALNMRAKNIGPSLRDAMTQLANDQDIDEETRDRLLQEYAAVMKTIEVLETVPDEDINAVAPFEPQIRAWLDSAR
ncbi:hypothetical protein DU002_18270 [Corallincola holothuriorum]|uniref:Uncharacterized protein n=3 Tax=Corallincola TaxID=1775176 RepID=A0A368MZY6_9GAMM|nr:hypothetical protein DU002_18270 [Corallincola holothuriorum]